MTFRTTSSRWPNKANLTPTQQAAQKSLLEEKRRQGIAFRDEIKATADQVRRNAWQGSQYHRGNSVDVQRNFFPSIKEDLIKNDPTSWKAYNSGADNGQTTPRQRRIQGNTFALEGLMRNTDNTTPGGFVEATRTDLMNLAGKSDSELDAYPARRRARDAFTSTGFKNHGDFYKATPQQIAALHRAYYDDVLATVGGMDVFDSIDDDNAASAFADTMFVHGRSKGAKILQQALNAHRAELGERIMLDEDGEIGPDTVKEYRHLIGTKENKQRLMQLLAEKRREERSVKKGDKSGYDERFSYFEDGGS